MTQSKIQKEREELESSFTCTYNERKFLDRIKQEQKRPVNKNCDLFEIIIEWLRIPTDIKKI